MESLVMGTLSLATDEIGTEKVVRSGQSTLAEPDTIEEVWRILREQVAEEDRSASK
jgi:hypothetical protein